LPQSNEPSLQSVSERPSLAAAILEAREAYWRRLAQEDAGKWHKRNPTLGTLDKCLRAEVLSITHWDARPPVSPDLKARFAIGNERERVIGRLLEDIGFELVEGQRPFELNGRDGTLVATGRIDGRLRWHGAKPVYECKSMHPNFFAQVRCLEDLHTWPWTERYLWQIQGYLLAADESEGLIVLDNLLGGLKVFDVTLDLEVAEWVLSHCEKVVEYLKRDEVPPFHSDPSHCRRCEWRGRQCNPELDHGPGIVMLSDPELAAELVEREKLDEARKRYDELDKHAKAAVKATLPARFEVGDIHRVIVGDFMATAKGTKYTSYDIPADVKAKYATPGIQVRTSFDRLIEPTSESEG